MHKATVLPPGALVLLLLAAPATAQSHDAHHQQVTERGDRVMGFDHEKTTHHFRLTKTGGTIEAKAKDPFDDESRDRIRMHFSHIAKMFAEGNFQAPMLIHGRVPPGVPEMKKRKAAIRYEVEETPRGGRIVITTNDATALSAIHEFLRFQIRDHETGDSLEVAGKP